MVGPKLPEQVRDASLGMAPIPTPKGEDFAQARVIAILTDYAVGYLASSLAKGRTVQSAAAELFEAFAVLPAFPLALRAVLDFNQKSQHNVDPALREWCRSLHAAPAALEAPLDLLLMFRATNYLVAS